MKKWLLYFFLAFIALQASTEVVQASSQFVEDSRFIPNQSYTWINGEYGKFASFEVIGQTHRVYDRSSKWEPVSTGVIYMCGFEYGGVQKPGYDHCGTVSTGTQIAKQQISFQYGYYLVFGHYENVPDPLPTVSISPDSIEFSETVEVSISGSSGAKLYYSLDGSEPSILYSGPITLTTTTTVRAKAVSSSGSSAVISRTYTKKKTDVPPGGGGGNVGDKLPDYNLMDDPVLAGTFWNYLGSVMKLGLPFLLIVVALIVVDYVTELIINAIKARRSKYHDDDDDW